MPSGIHVLFFSGGSETLPPRARLRVGPPTYLATP
jgi:hypothetical protein